MAASGVDRVNKDTEMVCLLIFKGIKIKLTVVRDLPDLCTCFYMKDIFEFFGQSQYFNRF